MSGDSGDRHGATAKPTRIPRFRSPLPTLDGEMRRLVKAYGREAVRDAAKAETGKPRGRKPKPDWQLLLPYCEQDAIDWLADRKLRSRYSIEKEVSERHPGQSVPATMERTKRKLRKERRLWRLLIAYRLTTEGRLPSDPNFEVERYSFAHFLRTLEELAKVCGRFAKELEFRRLTLERYRKLHGEPNPATTWGELENRLNPTGLGGLLGAAALGWAPPGAE
jgi:hypothetical protein